MSFYQTEQQIYSVMAAFFDQVQDMEPNPVEALISARLILRLRLSSPDAMITVSGRQSPIRIDYGETNGRADLEIAMTAEIFHLILLDAYSTKQGFMNGEIQVKGPIFKALAFVDFFVKGRALYPQILEEQKLV
jgi:hypothetical protein